MFVVRTVLLKSLIHGIGVFTLEPIKKGQLIWEFNPVLDIRIPETELDSYPEAAREYIRIHSYVEIVDSRRVMTLCTDNSQYVNHSLDPNMIESEDGLSDIAARDIAAGEELTCNYYAFDLAADEKLGKAPSDDRPLWKGYSYLSDKVESRVRPGNRGYGVYAIQPISKGELINLWGGKVSRFSELDTGMSNFTQRVIQIEEGLFLETPDLLEASDFFNHCCDPNAGMTGQIGLVAMRNIEPGEEVCLDYAMCDGMSYDEFDCSCESTNCRGRVTGQDWSRPELWERYDGYFSPYLQRRIDAIKNRVSQNE